MHNFSTYMSWGRNFSEWIPELDMNGRRIKPLKWSEWERDERNLRVFYLDLISKRVDSTYRSRVSSYGQLLYTQCDLTLWRSSRCVWVQLFVNFLNMLIHTLDFCLVMSTLTNIFSWSDWTGLLGDFGKHFGPYFLVEKVKYVCSPGHVGFISFMKKVNRRVEEELWSGLKLLRNHPSHLISVSEEWKTDQAGWGEEDMHTLFVP